MPLILRERTDVIGRPYALMFTAGNVSDIKAARAFQRAGRMRYLLAGKGGRKIGDIRDVRKLGHMH